MNSNIEELIYISQPNQVADNSGPLNALKAFSSLGAKIWV